MQIKLFRVYFGDYIANQERLAVLGYTRMSIGKPKILVLNSDQGLGQIKGVVSKENALIKDATIKVFKASTNTLLWSVKTNANGQYALRNLAVGMNVFVTASLPDDNSDAMIHDKIMVI